MNTSWIIWRGGRLLEGTDVLLEVTLLWMCWYVSTKPSVAYCIQVIYKVNVFAVCSVQFMLSRFNWFSLWMVGLSFRINQNNRPGLSLYHKQPRKPYFLILCDCGASVVWHMFVFSSVMVMLNSSHYIFHLYWIFTNFIFGLMTWFPCFISIKVPNVKLKPSMVKDASMEP